VNIQTVQLRRPQINIDRRHIQTNEPLINTFRLLSAVAVISDEVSNINEALLSADRGWSTA
jgi:hypothetical protein